LSDFDEIWRSDASRPFDQVYLLTLMEHDAASRKIDHIALPTKYNYQATSVGR